MWFKQAQLFEFEDKTSIETEELKDRLGRLPFTPCLSGLPISQGWVSPTDEDDLLVYSIPGFLLICLQTETKLLPSSIVRQRLSERIKEIELTQARKVSYKEKNTLKQGVYQELLPKAFGRLTRDYALIDTKNNWLILDTNNTKITENFISFLNRSLDKIKISAPETKKLSPILTNWLLNSTHPKSLNIEDACILQDPNQTERSIRIKKQDLSANCIQALIKKDFEVSQMKMTWNYQITFVLKNDFTFQSLQYQDKLTELSDTDKNDLEEGSLKADLFIMSDILTKMFTELLLIFVKTADAKL